MLDPGDSIQAVLDGGERERKRESKAVSVEDEIVMEIKKGIPHVDITHTTWALVFYRYFSFSFLLTF